MTTYRPWGTKQTFVETVAIPANAANVKLDAHLVGWFLIQAHIKTSADDAVTLSILKSSGGAVIGTVTTTAGTTGEFISLGQGLESRYLTEAPCYTLSDMASGTATLELVLSR